MASVSSRAVDFDRRSDGRISIDRPAVLRIGTDAVDIRVDDLTRDGCKVTTDVSLGIGSQVTLGFAGVGQAQATIIWCDGASYGCVFAEPLPPGAVTAATRNNVDRFAGHTPFRPTVKASDVKWSPRSQALLIAGVTSALWIALIAGVLLFH